MGAGHRGMVRDGEKDGTDSVALGLPRSHAHMRVGKPGFLSQPSGNALVPLHLSHYSFA